MRIWYAFSDEQSEEVFNRMAHAAKFKKGEAHSVLGHCLRERSEDGEQLRYRTNSEIDLTRTQYNKVLGDCAKPHERLRELITGKVRRADYVTMIDWVITFPKELEGETSYIQKMAFFDSCFNFVQRRYGTENVLGGYCHFDETTPHIHIPFVPLRDGKLAAKYMLNQADLKTFHDDLCTYLAADRQVTFLNADNVRQYVHNGSTARKGGSKDIDTFKAESRQREIDERLQQSQQKLIDVNRQLYDATYEQDALEVIKDVAASIDDIVQGFPEVKPNLIGKDKGTIEIEPYNESINRLKALKSNAMASFAPFKTYLDGITKRQQKAAENAAQAARELSEVKAENDSLRKHIEYLEDKGGVADERKHYRRQVESSIKKLRDDEELFKDLRSVISDLQEEKDLYLKAIAYSNNLEPLNETAMQLAKWDESPDDCSIDDDIEIVCQKWAKKQSKARTKELTPLIEEQQAAIRQRELEEQRRRDAARLAEQQRQAALARKLAEEQERERKLEEERSNSYDGWELEL